MTAPIENLPLNHVRIAILSADGFEESELLSPLEALKNAGAEVDVISPHSGLIQAFKHFEKAGKVKVTQTLDDADPDQYDAVMLPGGALNADTLRTHPKAQYFLQKIHAAGKPLAAICHAAWTLISAKLVEGRTLTSYPTIRDDIENAGGNWVDREVVIDDHWITSRQPSDLPAFNREMIKTFAEVTQELKDRKAA